MADFHDELAPQYHQIFTDWDASIERQGQALAALMRSEWPGCARVLDVSCGIGIEAIALAHHGFRVRGSDLSAGAVERAAAEARSRAVEIDFSVCDMRDAHDHHGGGFDIVVSCDNAIPHLLTDADIARALGQMHACLRPGGGCLLTLRDYAHEERGRNLVKPHGARVHNGKRYLAFQVWDFDGEHYDLTLFIVEEDLATAEVTTRATRSRCYAIGTGQLAALMEAGGFTNVRRIDGVFHQPVLVGTRPH